MRDLKASSCLKLWTPMQTAGWLHVNINLFIRHKSLMFLFTHH